MGDQGSIPGRVILNTSYIVVMAESSLEAQSVATRAVNPRVRTPARPTILPTFNQRDCDKHRSSSTNWLTVYVENQPVAGKVCCVENWFEKTREYMRR